MAQYNGTMYDQSGYNINSYSSSIIEIVTSISTFDDLSTENFNIPIEVVSMSDNILHSISDKGLMETITLGDWLTVTRISSDFGD